jgi:hypothetical protein
MKMLNKTLLQISNNRFAHVKICIIWRYMFRLIFSVAAIIPLSTINAESLKICKNISMPALAEISIEELVKKLSNNSINDLFMRFPVPVLYEATYYSDSIPSKYTEELEKLNKLSALNDQHRKEYKATEEYQIKKEQSKNGIVTITLSREAKEISNANTKQALKVMYMRMSQPFGIELNFGAQCEGSWKFTFHKVNRQWEVYDNSPSTSGYPCHHPTEICDETYNQQVKRDS